MPKFDVFYNEDRLEPEAPTGEYRYSIHADDIDDAVQKVADADLQHVERFETLTEKNFDRSTLTWKHEGGYDASLVIEGVE